MATGEPASPSPGAAPKPTPESSVIAPEDRHLAVRAELAARHTGPVVRQSHQLLTGTARGRTLRGRRPLQVPLRPADEVTRQWNIGQAAVCPTRMRSRSCRLGPTPATQPRR